MDIKKTLVSSANPEKVSLTVQSSVGFVISLAVGYFTMRGMPIEAANAQESLALLGDQLIVLISHVASAVTAAMALYGAARKVWMLFVPKE